MVQKRSCTFGESRSTTATTSGHQSENIQRPSQERMARRATRKTNAQAEGRRASRRTVTRQFGAGARSARRSRSVKVMVIEGAGAGKRSVQFSRPVP